MKHLYIFFSALCAVLAFNASSAAAQPAAVPAVDAKTDTVEIKTNLYNVLDYTAKQGIWMIQALDYEMSEYEVVLVVQSKSFVGTYTAKDILYKGNNNAPLTCLYLQNSDMTDEVSIEVKSGHGVVADKGSVRTFDFYLDAADGKVYHLLVSYEWFTFEFDADEDFQRNYDKCSVWTEEGGVAVLASDAQSRIGMIFYVADNTVADIPVGTYTFSADMTAGTVLASLGVDKVAKTLVPSYAATIDADYNADKMWFLVSGKVTVEEADGQRTLTVDALNSKGKRVQAVIPLPAATALEGFEADSQAPLKTLHNGRVVIIRNGVMFDLNGNPVAD